jgi:HD-GYP domain-containing protein (c-di-GMP phosphodiesterase class II)
MGIQDGSLYLPVSLADVQNTPVTESTLFLKSRDNYVVFREAGSRVDRQDITRLKSSGVETLYVLCTDGSEIDNYVDRHLTDALSDPNLGSSQKAHILTASSAAIAREIMDHPNVIEINRARPIIDATAGQAISSPETLFELIRSSGADDSLQTNMVNSAIYALALCGPLGITDRKEMEVMALAGFLHDIGKTQIPRDVLYKQGPLSKSEWTLMRQHVLLGHNLLRQIRNLPAPVLEATRSHHERMDGQGYPDGLSGGDIPFVARVIAVVDVLNALTVETPYRRRLTAFEAITMMRDRMEGQFDREILRALIFGLARPE